MQRLWATANDEEEAGAWRPAHHCMQARAWRGAMLVHDTVCVNLNVWMHGAISPASRQPMRAAPTRMLHMQCGFLYWQPVEIPSLPPWLPAAPLHPPMVEHAGDRIFGGAAEA
eukprot:163101-Chlamydomonas_euryale.AAC.8